MSEVRSVGNGKLTPEAEDALRATGLGDPYLKARGGAQRAGRTRSINGLIKRGLVTYYNAEGGHIWPCVLTEAGQKIMVTILATGKQ